MTEEDFEKTARTLMSLLGQWDRYIAKRPTLKHLSVLLLVGENQECFGPKTTEATCEKLTSGFSLS